MRGQVDPQGPDVQLLLARVAGSGGTPTAQHQGARGSSAEGAFRSAGSAALDHWATLGAAGTVAEGPTADGAVFGAVGSTVLPDARVQHTVSLVPGHWHGRVGTRSVQLLAHARAAGERGLAQRIFEAIVKIAREHDLLSSEHLTVDGTLIEAWAGAKSFKPKDGPPPTSDCRGGVDFRGSTPPNEGDQPRVRITEHPLDALVGAKAREGIYVRQPAAFDSFRHAHIIPTFRPCSRCICSYQNKLGVMIRPFDLPARNHVGPNIIEPLMWLGMMFVGGRFSCPSS